MNPLTPQAEADRIATVGSPSSPLVVLATLIAGAGAAVAAVSGVLNGPDPVSFTTARDQTVTLFGGGIYRFDSLFSGAANRGTDVVTVFIVLPVLVIAIVGYRRGSLRAALLLTGAQAWLLYAYATMAVGAAYNPLFLLYVTVFSASLWALVLTMSAIDTRRLEKALPALPRRGPAVLMMVSGVVTAVIWWAPVLAALWSGAVPARLDGYTTLVTVAVDSAVITPAAVTAAVLIWQRQAVGYRIAVPLIFLETLLAPMIAMQTVSQLSAGVSFAPGELVGPLAGFVILAVAAGVVLFSVLRAIPGLPDDMDSGHAS